MSAEQNQQLDVFLRRLISLSPTRQAAAIQAAGQAIAGQEPDRLLLSPREAGRLLSLSRVTLWRLARAGRLPAVRIGRLVRFRQADVLKLANECQTTGNIKHD